jgi:pimeloyl-ACP methyl ester carboxylesterase
MNKKSILIAMGLLSLGFQSQAIELSECRIGAESSPNKVKAECGTFAVPENRENPSRMIDLNIASVRTKSTEKKSDPVIMLAGGPGQSSVESYPGTHAAFRKIRNDRDIILVDQRGTGQSNPISCDFDMEIMEQASQDESLYFNELKKCVDNLDADTRYYTTPESIKDLEEVRKALKIEKWNLLGVSYGTRKASTYIKMFPDSIRSVILDGVVPHQEPLAQSHEVNLVNALRKQFAQCEAQPACKETFGDVEQQMWKLIEAVENQSPVVRIQNPMTGEYDEITLTKEYVAIALRLFSYSANSMNLVPLMIAKANQGQYETVASQALMIGSALQEGISNVEMSIICAEDAPFYDLKPSPENNLFGDNFLERTIKSCNVWPHIRVDASFKEPVSSDLPVLLLSGELDPVTPPSFAELAMETLSNSQHLVAKGQGHNVFPQGCMPKIIAQFVDDPESELDTECMQDFDYNPFFINMMGPKQ